MYLVFHRVLALINKMSPPIVNTLNDSQLDESTSDTFLVPWLGSRKMVYGRQWRQRLAARNVNNHAVYRLPSTRLFSPF